MLQIDTVPRDLQALPLAEQTPLITLGFPLGSQTQAETINVSVTSGHVRRTFENMFQVDTSLHPGNSGGPFIDARGRVVGLATTVATGWAMAPFPVATPLSDIGLVLPITKAAAFLEEIKAGKIKWNGEIDVVLDQRLQEIRDAALRHDWNTARELADKELGVTRSPSLIMAAAVMHLCSGDHKGARGLFDRVLSVDPERNLARLLILVADWIDGWELTQVHTQYLTALDWRSPDEFLGYLAGILAGETDARKSLSGGYSASEKSWLHVIAGLIEDRRRRPDSARLLFEEAALSGDLDDWSLYLALAQLDRIQRLRTTQAVDPSVRKSYQQQSEEFDSRMAKAIIDKKELQTQLAPITSALQNSANDISKQRYLLGRLRELAPDDGNALVAQAFTAAMAEDWDSALSHARQFNALPGRINAAKLSVDLLKAELLHMQGHSAQARDSLETYGRRIADPWYRELSNCLMDPTHRGKVIAEAGESPENLLTGHTALGFWAEGSNDAPGALKHYREALGSYLDHRIEYEFAMARLKHLREVID